MGDLAIYGAGGFGREVALMVEQMNEAKAGEWNLIGFFDDGRSEGEVVDGLPVLGNVDRLNMWAGPLALVVAISDGQSRAGIVRSIAKQNIDFPVLVHPCALAGKPVNRFGRGTIITAGCVLTTGVVVEDFVIVNLMTTIGHDVRLGSYSSIMPGCNISGGVTIGEHTFVGTGAQILQGLSIGTNCRVGAGAVVTKSVPDGKTVLGVPARVMEERVDDTE